MLKVCAPALTWFRVFGPNVPNLHFACLEDNNGKELKIWFATQGLPPSFGGQGSLTKLKTQFG